MQRNFVSQEISEAKESQGIVPKVKKSGMLVLSEPIKKQYELSTTSIALANPLYRDFSVEL